MDRADDFFRRAAHQGVFEPRPTVTGHDDQVDLVLLGILGDFVRDMLADEDGIVVAGGRELRTRDTLMLGEDVIHSVTNPRQHDFTGSVHIYGGDYFGVPRSLWDAETLEEGPADGARLQQLFEDANARLKLEMANTHGQDAVK